VPMSISSAEATVTRVVVPYIGKERENHHYLLMSKHT